MVNVLLNSDVTTYAEFRADWNALNVYLARLTEKDEEYGEIIGRIRSMQQQYPQFAEWVDYEDEHDVTWG